MRLAGIVWCLAVGADSHLSVSPWWVCVCVMCFVHLGVWEGSDGSLCCVVSCICVNQVLSASLI